MKAFISILLLLVVAAPVVAQEREIRDANLPRALETRLLRMYDGAAERYDGAVTIEAGREVRGDIAAVGGPLHIAGRVVGDVAMVGGDVVLEPGGSVMGDVTVVGGQVRMADDAVVAGAITAYGAAPGTWRRTDRRDRDRGERERADRDPAGDEAADEDDDWRRRDRERRYADRGHSRLSVRTGVGYNRVEGLPVMFGPVIETAGATPLRLEAFAIWRTEMGASLDGDRMGYQVRAEQFLTGNRAASVGGTVYSVVDPMDRWQLRDLEASLAAVLFRQDYRDHFERTGWSAFARLRPAPGLDARVTYRDERHGALPVTDPWALFNRSDSWRLQPLVAEGTIRTLGASVELDRRSPRSHRHDEAGARSGWLARASIERPVGGVLVRPALGAVAPDTEDDAPPPAIPATPMDTDFTVGMVDIRRYNPVGYGDGLHFRVVAGGSLTDAPLPPQYQHAVGGPGTLPGFTTFHGDCGARRATGSHDGQRYFPAYGCDRFALGQVEYRGRLSLDFGFGDWRHDHDYTWWDELHIDVSPTWVVFMDAGRGWANADPLLAGGGTRNTGTMVDAGMGILFGRLGLYAALPLNSEVDQKPRFMLRWGPRF